MSADRKDVEQYLSLINASDSAVEDLIGYFSKIDNEVVIVFFGDHFPQLNSSFYEEVHGGPFDTLDEQMLQYEVPFFIWTNFESREETVELTSLNYLSVYMFEKAGMEPPPYDRYLETLRETIPAMNSRGYYSNAAGRFLEMDMAEGDEETALREYSYMEYNCLFDPENLNEIFSAYYD